jgi:TP901 family phage tail tape measure protein
MSGFNIEYAISARDSLTPVLRKIQAEVKRLESSMRRLVKPIKMTADTKQVEAALKRVQAMKFTIKGDIQAATGGLNKTTPQPQNVRGAKAGGANGGMGAIAGGAAALGGGAIISQAMQATYEYSQAITGLKKAAGGTDAEIKSLAQAAQQLSLETGKSTASILDMMTSSSKAGVAAGDLKNDALDLVKTSVAFDMSAEETAQTMSNLRNSFFSGQDYATQQKGLMDMAAMMSYVADTGASSEGGLSNFMGRVAGLEKTMGISKEKLIAMGATFESLGIPVEVGARAMNSFGTNLSTIDPKALAALGINYTDAMSRMNAGDMNGVILDIIKSTENLSVTARAATLKDIFGQEFADEAVRVGGAVDIYNQSLESANDKTKQAAKFQENYKTQLESFANAADRAKTGLADVTRIAFEPFMNAAANAMAGVMKFMVEHPKIAQFAGALVSVAAAMGAIAAVAGIIAFVGAPVLLLVAAIGSVAFVMSQVWQKSSALRGSLSELWSSVSAAFAPIMQLVGGLGGVGDAGAVVDKIFVGIGAAIAVVISGVATLIDGFVSLVTIGLQIMKLDFSGVADTAKGFASRFMERGSKLESNVKADWAATNAPSPIAAKAAQTGAVKQAAGVTPTAAAGGVQAATIQQQAATTAQAAATQNQGTAATETAASVVNAQSALTQQQAATTQASVGAQFTAAASQMMAAAQAMMVATSRPLTVNVAGGAGMGDQGR